MNKYETYTKTNQLNLTSVVDAFHSLLLSTLSNIPNIKANLILFEWLKKSYFKQVFPQNAQFAKLQKGCSI